MATNFEDAYKEYTEGGRGQAVAGVYDAQTQAELNGLKSAYDQNLSNQQAAREKIGGAYQAAGNDMQAQYERNRRNLNQQAAANGINTGAGSQQQLALQNVWNRDYGKLQGQQAQAYADADRAIADLQTNYQNAIQQAQAQGDYRKMAALLDDYQQAYNQQLQQAQTLASYGDFSGYDGIYSADQIANMRNAWIASNPQMAYNMGLITAEELARMTGGTYSGSSSRGSYGGYYSPSYTPPGNDNDTTTTTPPNTSVPAYNQGTVSAAGQQLINNARRLGSTPAEISQAAIEAAERGLIPQSEVNTVIAQANQANVAGNGARTQAAGLIAAGAAWSPSIYQQTGISQAEWARMLDAAHGSSSSNSNAGTTNSNSTATWSNNTSARGAAAHANDEENERRRRAAASASGANAAGVSGAASAAPVNPLLAAAQLYF